MNPGAQNFRLDEQLPEMFPQARTQRELFLEHFGFRESPFGVTPDPRFLFWSRMHNSALQALINSIESNLGFSVLIGHPGTGKTTLLFHLLAHYRESARTAFVFQTQCRPQDLIRHIASELELPPTRGDEVFLHRKLSSMLLKEARAGRKVLIVIDEAQNLKVPSLEAVRLLSDFETGPSKLLHVVLSGSPQLAETLLSPDLWQLAQRINTISRLEPLSDSEVRQYVKSRLATVSSRATEGLFSTDSLNEIASRSGGIPRIVNSLCHGALTLAYTEGRRSVNAELVRLAANELDLAEPGNRNRRVDAKVPELADIPVTRGASAISIHEDLPANGHAVELGRNANRPSIAQGVNASQSGQRLEPTLINQRRSGPLKISRTLRLKNTGRDRDLLAGALALVVLIALGSWVGWSQLQGGHPGANVGKPQVSERPPNTDDGAAPKVMDQSNPVGVQASTNAIAPQPAPIQASASMSTHPGITTDTALPVDMRPDLLVPSRIRPQPQAEAAAEPLPPSNVALLSKAFNKELPPVVNSSPASPRLEPATVTGSPSPAYAPHATRMIQPEYPAKARQWHIEGEVQVELTIDRNGTVKKVRGLSGNSILLQAAEEAARQWQYAPYAGDQLPAPAVTRVRFTFKLNP